MQEEKIILPANLPACSPSCPHNAERQAGKLQALILKSLVQQHLV